MIGTGGDRATPNGLSAQGLRAAANAGRLSEYGGSLEVSWKLSPADELLARYYWLFLRQQGRLGELNSYLSTAGQSGLTPVSLAVERALSAAMSGELGKAEAFCQEALTADAARDDATIILAKVALAKGNHADAERYFARTLELDPVNADAAFHLALAYRERKQYAAAAALLEQALSFRPGHPLIVEALEYTARNLADWPRMQSLTPQVLQMTCDALSAGGPLVEEPFRSISRYDSDHILKQIASYSLAKETGSAASHTARWFPDDAKDPDRPLRIAYMTGNYGDHPLMHIIGGLFGLHDRSRAKPFFVGFGKVEGQSYPQHIISDADDFIVLDGVEKPDQLAAMRAYNFDIVVDLDGFTENSHIGLFTQGIAPIQIHWLGYPAPLPDGIADYQIVDPVICPAAERGNFPKAVACLPLTYKIMDQQHSAPAPGKAAGASVFGEPEGYSGVLFGCFCNVTKIQPELFDVWARILARVPESLLVLASTSEPAMENIRQAARSLGLDAGRIIFAPRVADRGSHLARLGRIDLALDTWRYGGHVTTIDMLSAGVPVLAKRGSHFASRVSQSLLQAAGLGELIAADAPEYQAMAIGLAENRDHLMALRHKVSIAREQSPLFDTAGRVRELEALYGMMWRRYCQGLPPADLELSRA